MAARGLSLVPALVTALLLATAALPAAGLDVVALQNTTGWRLDNQAGFANVSIEGVSVPAAVLQLLQQAGLVGNPLYRCALPLRQYWHRVLRRPGCPPAARRCRHLFILPAVSLIQIQRAGGALDYPGQLDVQPGFRGSAGAVAPLCGAAAL
jgi:hypothetical protein